MRASQTRVKNELSPEASRASSQTVEVSLKSRDAVIFFSLMKYILNILLCDRTLILLFMIIHMINKQESIHRLKLSKFM